MNEEDLCLIAPPRVWAERPLPPRREFLWIKEGNKCHWCGRATRLTVEDAPDQATIEHIIPRYKGGTNDPENLVSACKQCNGRRNSEDMKGLPDGTLMQGNKGKSKTRRVFLTRDEKREILAKLPAKQGHMIELDVMRLQRDQALGAVLELRKELEHWRKTAANLEEKWKAMTVGKLIRLRLAGWLAGA